MLTNECNGFLDVSYIAACFNKSVNIMLAHFANVPSYVLCNIFIQYCSNLYGIALCDLGSSEFMQLCILWRKALRCILQLHYRTHNRLLPLISGISTMKNICYSRILKFFFTMCEFDNILLYSLVKRCLQQSVSNMGKNINMTDKCINSNTHCFYLLYSDAMDKLVNCNEVYYEKDIIHADICKDLINMRDDVCDGPLSYNDCKMLLEHICTC